MLNWKNERKSSPLVFDSIGVDYAIMVFNDPLTKRKSDSVSAKLRFVVELLKDRKDMFGILLAKSNAVIGHYKSEICSFFFIPANFF